MNGVTSICLQLINPDGGGRRRTDSDRICGRAAGWYVWYGNKWWAVCGHHKRMMNHLWSRRIGEQEVTRGTDKRAPGVVALVDVGT